MHPKAHFGILAHNFLCDAARGLLSNLSESELKARWRASVSLYEERLRSDPFDAAVIPLSKSCDDFEVSSLRLIKYVVAHAHQRPVESGESCRSSEVEAVAKDGMIAGRLDRIAWEAGELVVSDIKTGRIINADGRLREDLRMQVLLYSYLVHEKYCRWPARLRVLPLHGEPVEIRASPEEISALAESVRGTLREANRTIAEVLAGRGNETDLATASPEACRFCRYRLTCEAYWTARTDEAGQDWPRDVAGTVVAQKPLGRGLKMVELQDAHGRALVVRGAPESALSADLPGRPVRICDLRPERAVGVYSWRPTSFLWALA